MGSRDEREREEGRKRSRRHTEALITTSSVLSERYRRGKFNDIKKEHQR